MKKLRAAGFTLIEVLICVAVIALLSTLAAPRAFAAITAARKAQVSQELKRIDDALVGFYLDHGFYPLKLNDLVTSGYLPGRTRFRSPVSGKWYFYAVDDNRDDHPPHAYILGAPDDKAESDFKLFHNRPLPQGRRADWTAFAWKRTYLSKKIWLYDESDEVALNDVPLDTLPDVLDLYRTACRQSTPAACDVFTN